MRRPGSRGIIRQRRRNESTTHVVHDKCTCRQTYGADLDDGHVRQKTQDGNPSSAPGGNGGRSELAQGRSGAATTADPRFAGQNGGARLCSATDPAATSAGTEPTAGC